MRLLFGLVLIVGCLVHSAAFSKKPDWPGKNGTAIIGFGLAELTPQASASGYAPTTFVFNYDIPKSYAANLAAGQIVVLSAKAAEQYNDIPSGAFLTYVTAQKLLMDADFHMSATITIDRPGLYLVGYGPWEGLITFDDTKDGRETYKISAQSAQGSIRWIDQDAGDLTIVNYAAMQNTESKGAIVRVRMLRDKSLLAPTNHAQPATAGRVPESTLTLNPVAAERVKLIDAKW